MNLCHVPIKINLKKEQRKGKCKNQLIHWSNLVFGDRITTYI